VLLGALLLGALLLGGAASPCRPCLPPLDLLAILQPPPADADRRTRAGLDSLRRQQAVRTEAETAAIRADVDETVFLFADVLGPGFAAPALPQTADLFATLGEEANAALNRAKDAWARPRPARLGPDLAPCLPTPATASYPGGHAALAGFYAAALARILPERRDALFARARLRAERRELCGLHHPSDTQAGYAAAAALAGALAATPSAAASLVSVAAELRPALGLPAAIPPLPISPPAPEFPSPQSEDFRVR